MAGNGSKSLPAIGFLTVVEQPGSGLFGGYLILNASGRPLEFHCTAPVKPNRAQEILYGPTLAPYLYGEQIGQTLIGRAKVEPLLVCTDTPPALAAREFISMPLVLVTSGGDSADASSTRIDLPHASTPAPMSATLVAFAMGRQTVAVSGEFASDRELATQRWQSYADGFDLAEPFTRIREAIEEAQRSAR